MININRYGMRFQSGMTMVELMIAMAITLFMLGGVLQVYTSSKQVYRAQSNLSRLQENARFALDYMVKNIRMAGYVGCLPLMDGGAIEDLVSGAKISSDTEVSIHEYDGTNWNAEFPGSSTYVKPGSDILVIKRGEVLEYPLVTSMANKSADVSISASNELAMNNVALISDCSDSKEVFKINSIDSSGNISHAPFQRAYDTDAVVMRFSDAIYYIRNKGNSEFSLYRRIGLSDEEMVEGVDDMQLDDNDSPDSIKISLLMRTLEDGIAVKPQTIQFNGGQVTTTDKHVRKAYSMTVKRRN